jgi:UDP:flavonoid glycosyltransferase YjiC (YdhE family)
MRVLFTMFPWPSHYLPIVPLGWACQLAGHEVLVASMSTLTKTIVESGLPAAVIGPDGGTDEVLRRAGMSGPAKDSAKDKSEQVRWPDGWIENTGLLGEQHQQFFGKVGTWASLIGEAQVPDLVRLIESWRPDLIIHDGTQFAGPVAAAITGVPAVRYLQGNPGLLRVDTAYGTDAVPAYADLFRKFGVEPKTEPVAWVDPCPPSVQFTPPPGANYFWMRYLAYNGAAELPEWVHEKPSRRRVCVTWGVTEAEMNGSKMLDTFRQMLDAVTGLDVETVIAVSPKLRDLLGDLPANVRVAVSVPLHALLPSCSAIVHHGGPGTTMTAAVCGVPQLLITKPPHFALTGERLADTESARHVLLSDVPAGADGVTAIRDHVTALLDDPVHQKAAAELRAEIAAQPSPVEVVRQLESLV